MHTNTPAAPPDRTAHGAQPSEETSLQTATLSSTALLQGGSSIVINHLGTSYVLRATRAGKLILTK